MGCTFIPHLLVFVPQIKYAIYSYLGLWNYWTIEVNALHTNVTLVHKTSLKSLGYICSNSQKYIVWVKIIDFYAKTH